MISSFWWRRASVLVLAGLVLFAPALFVYTRGAHIGSPNGSIPESAVGETLGPTTDLAAASAKISSPVFVAGWSSARQAAGSGTPSQSLTICNLAGGCKAGDTIIVNYWQCCTTGESLSNVSDSEGNVYSEIVLAFGVNPNFVMADVWGTISIRADSSSLTITATYPDTSHYRAIFVEQYRNALGFGASHFTGQSSCTSASESLTTTGSNSLVAVSFDIGFMTGMTQTGGPAAFADFSYNDNANGFGLFLWDSPVSRAGMNTWTWSVSGCRSGYQSFAIELTRRAPLASRSPVFVAGWSSARQAAGSGTPSQSLTICNLAGGCKAGDTIIVNYWQCCSTAQSLSNVTDSQGSAYSEILLANGPNGNNVFADIWGTVSLKIGTNSLTLIVTYPDTSHYRAIFVQQYRSVLGFGATHFTGQSNGGTVSESLTTTGSNSLVAVSFDIGFMTGMTQTGGPAASINFSYDDNTNGFGLFLWDSAVTKTGAYTWTWSSSGVNSTFESVAIELK